MAEKFDVVIVGSAITGSVLALALSSFSQHNMRIAVIEKMPTNYTQQGGFDTRSIALAEGSLQKFSQIQPRIGENLAVKIRQMATPIKQVHVSDAGHFGKVSLMADELGLSQLGCVIELARLGDYLTECLSKQTNVQLFCPNEVIEVNRSAQECLLTLQDGQQLHSQLMIAADGTQSKLAHQCGVKTELCHDYQQSAIIANITISQPHHFQAFERFTAEGPIALLPMSEQQMSLVWCVKQAESLMASSDQVFLTRLQQQVGWKLGRFTQVSKRFAYPLTSQKASAHVHHRLAIVGNAAQLLHPVAGQGFNLALRDLYTLATLLGDAFGQGKDLGEFSLLQYFMQARQPDQQHIMQLTNGLVSLFTDQTLAVQAVRNLALFAIEHTSLGRSWIAHQALGWH